MPVAGRRELWYVFDMAGISTEQKKSAAYRGSPYAKQMVEETRRIRSQLTKGTGKWDAVRVLRKIRYEK